MRTTYLAYLIPSLFILPAIARPLPAPTTDTIMTRKSSPHAEILKERSPNGFDPIPELGGQIGDYSDALSDIGSDSDSDLPGSDDDLDEWAENFVPGGGKA